MAEPPRPSSVGGAFVLGRFAETMSRFVELMPHAPFAQSLGARERSAARFKHVLIVCVTLPSFIAATSASAESIPAIHFDPTEGTCNAEGICILNGSRGWFQEGDYIASWTLGWDFQLSRQALVTHLAVADAGLDGLDTAFHVGIWQSEVDIAASQMSSVLLEEATVPPGEAAERRGLWRLSAIDPLLLVPGYRYVVGASPTMQSDDRRYFWNFDPASGAIDINAISFDPRVMVDDAYPRYSDASGFEYPNGALAVRGAYVGPNVFLMAVPEPGGSALMLVLVVFIGAGNLVVQMTRRREAQTVGATSSVR